MKRFIDPKNNINPREKAVRISEKMPEEIHKIIWGEIH